MLLPLIVAATLAGLAGADLGAMLHVWDPVAPLSWPNNTSLEPQCLQGMRRVALGLRNAQPWAEKIIDATGRSSARFMFASEYWLGSRLECDLINKDALTANTTDSTTTVFRIATLLVNLTHELTPKPRKISLGLCLPSECGEQAEVRQLMQLMLQQTAPRYGPPREIKVAKIRSLPGEYTFFGDPGFIIFFVLCMAILTVTVVGTSVDLHQSFKEKPPKKLETCKKGDECNANTLSYTARGPTGVVEERHSIKCPAVLDDQSSGALQSRALEILTAFSVRQNAKRFFADKEKHEGSLTTVHGLRVFSLIWVIACHTCLYTFRFSNNQAFRLLVEKDFLFQSISNGNFSVDTFFFVSGTLLAYVFLRSRDTKKPCTDSVVRSIRNFFNFFIYRFIRLTPPYVIALAFVSVTSQYQASHSVFDPPTWDHLTCPKVWWRNFLYINTLFPVQQMCMIWSWYLAADTQFYLVGTALLLIYIRRPRVAVVLSLVLLLASWAITGTISYNLQHQPSVDKPFDLFDDLYDKPWTRFGPYLVGMAAGWFLSETNGAVKMTKTVVFLGWTLAISTNFGLVHALYGRLLGTAASAAYVALSHTLWAVTIAWILVACTSGHGGWVSKVLSSKLLVPFSRATYCAYLVHSGIIQWALNNMDAPIIMNRDLVVQLIFGFVATSFMAGIALSIIVEAPVTRLLSLLLPIRAKSKPANQCTCSTNG
ncbi:O-acyltransferase like protein-like isoform X1 [Neocloeon triangulifer]|uniref:O-acyltransferase like protein-like isoform X1 n=1 Tax=Neocloeon triangulifer TaxID=2078957 RepID=UPI00286EEF35|nr:O-acyltransferase like protein-like isoform X1 [Neocloeon triangulifer]